MEAPLPRPSAPHTLEMQVTLYTMVAPLPRPTAPHTLELLTVYSRPALHTYKKQQLSLFLNVRFVSLPTMKMTTSWSGLRNSQCVARLAESERIH